MCRTGRVAGAARGVYVEFGTGICVVSRAARHWRVSLRRRGCVCEQLFLVARRVRGGHGHEIMVQFRRRLLGQHSLADRIGGAIGEPVAAPIHYAARLAGVLKQSNICVARRGSIASDGRVVCCFRCPIDEMLHASGSLLLARRWRVAVGVRVQRCRGRLVAALKQENDQ